MSNTVVSVTPYHWGHTSVLLSDGSSHIFARGEKVPSVGDVYPPEDPASDVPETLNFEVPDAMDPQASEAAPVVSEPVDSEAAGEDEGGTAPEPENGPRKERHQRAKAKKA